MDPSSPGNPQPTSNSLANRQTNRKLKPEEYDFFLHCEQFYWRTGNLPQASDEEEQRLLENPRFQRALVARGVRVPGQTKYKLLTEQQMTVANIMLDVHDKRSRLKKLTELGLTTSEYNTWLRDPVYRRYCLDRAEDLLVSNQAVAHLSLINRVEQGDLGSIKYFNALTGRFRETGNNTQVTVNTGDQHLHLGSNTLMQVVEIIQKHVHDPQLLNAISRDILQLTQPGVQETPPLATPPQVVGELVEK